jgi:hypothetical protein
MYFKQAMNGTLPKDFEEWNLTDKRGWSVLHVAKRYNNLFETSW